jgi:hypothetical protein
MNTNEIKVSDYDMESNISLVNIVCKQTKEINFLKINALAQEMKINELMKIIDIMVIVSPSIDSHMVTSKDLSIQNNNSPSVIEKDEVLAYHESTILWANIQKTSLMSKITEMRNIRKEEAEIVRLRVEAEKKKKAINDMLDRVLISEKTSTKEENLIQLEDTLSQELLITKTAVIIERKNIKSCNFFK